MSASRPRIGLLGGSFDPPHLGHCIMARDALEAAKLDRVLFVPAATPPHKRDRELTPPEHRLAMLRRAIEGNPAFGILENELARGGLSFTVDTVRALVAAQPETDWHWIIGADTLPELHTWKDIDALLELCTILTVYRPGVDPQRLAASALNLSPASAARAARHLVPGHGIGISSTGIRERVRQGLPIEYLVNPGVAAYIARHHLYC